MQTLRAVHSKDVEKYLDSLGVLGAVKQNNYHCSTCDKTISLKNFSAVYPREGKIHFVCDSIQCYEKAVNSN